MVKQRDTTHIRISKDLKKRIDKKKKKKVTFTNFIENLWDNK